MRREKFLGREETELPTRDTWRHSGQGRVVGGEEVKILIKQSLQKQWPHWRMRGALWSSS